MTVPLRSPQSSSGLALVPLAETPATKRDFTSDQEVRWCPGCGDYAILASIQGFMPTLGIARENLVFISGIGCAARLPYYMNTYGMHSIHGRAPAIATGLAVTRPDLSVWVIGGDGDMLSIGANHLLHTLRRNVNLKILLLNNRIYGLTKGQYSPTSEVGKQTKSTPMGSLDRPLNPLSVALGADATFVARSIDSDRKHLQAVLLAAAQHRGSAFVEILQNCDIYNDGAFDALKDPDRRDDAVVRLEHGQPVRFGAERQHGVRLTPRGTLEVVDATTIPEESLLVHDSKAEGPELGFLLSRLEHLDDGVTPIGIFRDVERTVYDDAARLQVAAARDSKGTADLAALLSSGDTWTVGGAGA
jgi:2-oxoglutarate/2-oxoacid ferredoxin oxidoreductase subunit beta